MARVQLQFRRVYTAFISNVGRLSRATSSGDRFGGLTTTPLPGSLGKHCQRFSLLQKSHKISCSQKPSFSFLTPVPWSAPTWHKDLKDLQRRHQYDQYVWNTFVDGNVVETEHVGDILDNGSNEVHTSSVLKKRKKKMNKHKYKKRRKMDKYKRRNLENIKERKRRVKERAAARE